MVGLPGASVATRAATTDTNILGSRRSGGSWRTSSPKTHHGRRTKTRKAELEVLEGPVVKVEVAMVEAAEGAVVMATLAEPCLASRRSKSPAWHRAGLLQSAASSTERRTWTDTRDSCRCTRSTRRSAYLEAHTNTRGSGSTSPARVRPRSSACLGSHRLDARWPPSLGACWRVERCRLLLLRSPIEAAGT